MMVLLLDAADASARDADAVLTMTHTQDGMTVITKKCYNHVLPNSSLVEMFGFPLFLPGLQGHAALGRLHNISEYYTQFDLQ